MKLMIVGVDGGTWSVMKPLIDEGRLPNFKSLMKESSCGILKSIDVEKYLSPALWMCIETGKNPEKHGIKDFYKVARYDVKTKRLYHLLDNVDDNIGQFRWYCTWPIEVNKGFTVPEWVARTPETSPPDLEFISYVTKHGFKDGLIKTGINCLKYGVQISTLFRAFKLLLLKNYLKEEQRVWYSLGRLLEVRLYYDIFLNLIKRFRPNYSTILFSAVDALQHQYWKYYEPETFDEDIPKRDIDRFKDVIPNVYIELDNFIGKLKGELPNDGVLVIVSDHGFHSKGIDTGDAKQYKIKATPLLRNLKLEEHFDISKVNFNTCLILKKGSSDDMVQKAVDGLKRFRMKSTGQSLIEITSVEDDRIYIKTSDDVKYTHKEVIIGLENKEISMEELIMDKPGISGCHHPDGIILVKGPNIKKDYWINNANLLDITPTILRLFDKPIAKDMDGAVIEEIFEEGFLKKHPYKEIDTYEDEKNESIKPIDDELTESEREDLESKLRSLGYLD